MASLQLMKRDPSYASSVEDINALMIWEMVTTAPLFAGMGESFYMKKWPPARLLGFASEREEASLWADRTMSEAW